MAADPRPAQLAGGRVRVEEAVDGAEVVGEIADPGGRETLRGVDRMLRSQLPAGALPEPAGGGIPVVDMVEDGRVVGRTVGRSLVARGQVDAALAVQPHGAVGVDIGAAIGRPAEQGRGPLRDVIGVKIAGRQLGAVDHAAARIDHGADDAAVRSADAAGLGRAEVGEAAAGLVVGVPVEAALAQIAGVQVGVVEVGDIDLAVVPGRPGVELLDPLARQVVAGGLGCSARVAEIGQRRRGQRRPCRRQPEGDRVPSW